MEESPPARLPLSLCSPFPPYLWTPPTARPHRSAAPPARRRAGSATTGGRPPRPRSQSHPPPRRAGSKRTATRPGVWGGGVSAEPASLALSHWKNLECFFLFWPAAPRPSPPTLFFLTPPGHPSLHQGWPTHSLPSVRRGAPRKNAGTLTFCAGEHSRAPGSGGERAFFCARCFRAPPRAQPSHPATRHLSPPYCAPLTVLPVRW